MRTTVVLSNPGLPADEAALCRHYWAHSVQGNRLRYAHSLDALVRETAHAQVFVRHALGGMSDRRSWLVQRMAETSALVLADLRCDDCGASLSPVALRYRTPDVPGARCARCVLMRRSAARAARPAPPEPAGLERLFGEAERRQLREGRHLSLRSRTSDCALHDQRMDLALGLGFVPLGAPVLVVESDGTRWLVQALVRAPGARPAGAPG
jgi:hypothetical protein